MAGEVTQAIPQKVLWGGGRSPLSTSYGKLMMWFFLISDALTFGGLLTALGFMKHKYADVWPVSEDVFFHFPFTHANLPLIYVAFMTFILIISSVTMVLGVEAGHRNDKKGVKFWLLLTIIGGGIFLGSQVWEWKTFILGNEEHSVAFQVGGENSIAHLALRLDENEEPVDYTMTSAANPDWVKEQWEKDWVRFGMEYGTTLEDCLPEHTEAHGDAHAEGDHAEGGHGEGHGHGWFFAGNGGHMANAAAVEAIKSGNAVLKVATKKPDDKYKREIIEGEAAIAYIKQADYVMGANLHRNEYGHNLYADFFFFITGFHGFHVFSGVVINFIVLLMVGAGVMARTGHYEMVEKAGLYWHFVDLVWVFVFTFFYLV